MRPLRSSLSRRKFERHWSRRASCTVAAAELAGVRVAVMVEVVTVAVAVMGEAAARLVEDMARSRKWRRTV